MYCSGRYAVAAMKDDVQLLLAICQGSVASFVGTTDYIIAGRRKYFADVP